MSSIVVWTRNVTVIGERVSICALVKTTLGLYIKKLNACSEASNAVTRFICLVHPT